MLRRPAGLPGHAASIVAVSEAVATQSGSRKCQSKGSPEECWTWWDDDDDDDDDDDEEGKEEGEEDEHE